MNFIRRSTSLTALAVLYLLFAASVAYGNESSEYCSSADTSAIVVSQNATYVLVGHEIEITIFACASNTRIKKISVNGMDIKPGRSGITSKTILAGSPGVHTVPVEVTYVNSIGKTQVFEHIVGYEVVQANAVVSSDKMNILYIGVDNPVTVATSAGNIRTIVSVKGAGMSITKVGTSRYLVRVKSVSDDCSITVAVDNKPVAGFRFRSRHLPVPTASLSSYKSGEHISAKDISNLPGIEVKLEDFTFDVKHTVLAYSVRSYSASGSRSSVNAGAAFSKEVRDHLSGLKSGSLIVIDDILVEESGGRKLSVPAVAYYIK